MQLINITKSFTVDKNRDIEVLKKVNLKIEKGTIYVIMGRSGSGKTTLVNIIGLLDNYVSGEYYIDDVEVSKLSESEKAKLRAKKFGFVFQSFYLNSQLTALENVMLPMLVNDKINKNDRKQIAKDLLAKMGLADRESHYPNQLSGGEQQRVAIARSLANDPEIIIADEPTGNLDEKTEIEILTELKNISKKGKSIIIVSHNPIVKKYCDIVYEIQDGKLVRGNL